MAPPRWKAGKNGQPPLAPPAEVQCNPNASVVCRINGAGAWTVRQLSTLAVFDQVLQFAGVGPTWIPAPSGLNTDEIVVCQPVT